MSRIKQIESKTLPVLLAIAIVISFLTNVGGFLLGNAATQVASGQIGLNATWSLGSDKTLVISGKGSTYDYDLENESPFSSFKESPLEINKVVVKSGITRIGSNTFGASATIEEIILPDTLTTIAEYGFFGIRKLEHITIPDSVSTIGDCAFGCCYSLRRC